MTTENNQEIVSELDDLSGTQLSSDQLDEMVGKYEKESNFMKSKGVTAKVITVVSVLMTIFQFAMAGFGYLNINIQRTIHLAFILFLAFLIYPARKGQKKVTALDWVMAIMAAGTCLYQALNWNAIALRAGQMNQLEMVLGFLLIVFVVEATRRAQGWILPILALIAMFYAKFGKYLPGVLRHRGFTVRRIVQQMYLSNEGIFGTPLGTSCTYVFLFVMFGVILAETGLSKYLTDLALAVAGDKPGGPAKMATLSSGLMGMISGSAVANVVTTGAFSIPLMKKLGYKNHFAGAVEAVASTGGQIMPPVMASASFIMSEYTGIPYKKIIIAAIIPAVLYYYACWVAVDLEARKNNLLGLKKEELPSAREGTRQYWHLLLPITLLIGMIMLNYATYYAAFYSTILLVVVSSLRKNTRLSPKNFLVALEKGVKQALGVGIATAVVGIVIGVVNMTGIGLRLSNIILQLSHNNLLLTMILTMLACFVLGMGLPTSAAYIVAASVAPVAMMKLGVSTLAAHMFILYYACLSNITPPVALAAFAGAGLAGAKPNKTGWTAVRLGLVGFIVPFMFVYSPTILMEGTAFRIIFGFITACIGVYLLAAGGEGYWKTSIPVWLRVVMIAGSLLLIDSGLVTDCIGIAVVILTYFIQTGRAKKAACA